MDEYQYWIDNDSNDFTMGLYMPAIMDYNG